jgi:hypothetical protein
VPLAQIAVELGLNKETVYKAARRYGIRAQPGIHTSHAMRACLPRSVPRDVRAAAEHTIGGWERLHRFRTAMDFPTIQAAANSTGVSQATLVRQFHRLEHDIGAALYTRAQGSRPMHPTRRGAALLKALDTAEASADATAIDGRRPAAPTRNAEPQQPPQPGRRQRRSRDSAG